MDVGQALILAGPDETELVSQAYLAFATASLDVAGVTNDPEELTSMVSGLKKDVIVVVEAELYGEPETALQSLAELSPARVVVVLPSWWSGEQGRFSDLPNLALGFTAPISWPDIVREFKTQLGTLHEVADNTGDKPAAEGKPQQPQPTAQVDPQQTRQATERPSSSPPPSPPPQKQCPQPRQRSNRVVAFWSGPAGGTGRTTLAMATGILAAEWGEDVVLLALSEPAVSAYLNLPRTPNISHFLETRDLHQSGRSVHWDTETRMGIVLGIPRFQAGVPESIGELIGELVDAAHESHKLVLLDLPGAPPGGTPWAIEPLRRTTDVVLVTPYSSIGVVAAIEALVTLRDVGATGRVHLALNRVRPGQIQADHICAGISGTWGSCPQVATRLPCLQSLGATLERGELPSLLLEPEQSSFLGGGGEAGWVNAVATLLEATTDLQRPVPAPAAATTSEGAQGQQTERQRRGRDRFSIGNLIDIELTD